MITKQTLLTTLSKFLLDMKKVFMPKEEFTGVNDVELAEMFDTTAPIFILGIDSIPEDQQDQDTILYDNGVYSWQEYAYNIAEAFDDGGLEEGIMNGMNYFFPFSETLEYEGKIYRVYNGLCNYTDDTAYNDSEYNMLGLLPIDMTYEELSDMSIEKNPAAQGGYTTRQECPFVMVTAGNITYTDNLDYSYALFFVRNLSGWTNPLPANTSEDIHHIYTDRYNGTYSIFADKMTKGTNYTFTWGQCFTPAQFTLDYEGETYEVFTDSEGWGGLLPEGTKLSDLYEHSFKYSSNNGFKKYHPFVLIYNGDDGNIDYDEQAANAKFTNLISVD